MTGGHPNAIVIFPLAGFRFTKGEPKAFARSDLPNPVTRFFCPNCGTAMGTRSPARPDSMIIKVGTLDDPSTFQPQASTICRTACPRSNGGRDSGGRAQPAFFSKIDRFSAGMEPIQNA